MSIDKDIKKDNVFSESQKALINLVYTTNFLIDKMESLFKEKGITRKQYIILRLLRIYHPEPLSINFIRENMLDKMSDVSRIVERMRIKGLLVRIKSKDDKRTVRINITDTGLDTLLKIEKEDQKFDQLLQNLSSDEVKDLNDLLVKIRENHH